MSDRLAEIRARVDAAAPGPWGVSRHEFSDAVYFQPVWSQDEDGIWDLESDAGRIYDEGGHSRADAEFIAHAREDIPFLLAEVAYLRGALDSTHSDV